MRHTTTVGSDYLALSTTQEKLDTFWDLIEDNDGLNWRVEHNGDVTLEVDDATLEVILTDNPLTAWEAFGAFRGGQKADGTRFYLSRPEYLKGTYIIKGIYKPDLSYHRGDYQERTYFFVQEGI